MFTNRSYLIGGSLWLIVVISLNLYWIMSDLRGPLVVFWTLLPVALIVIAVFLIATRHDRGDDSWG